MGINVWVSSCNMQTQVNFETSMSWTPINNILIHVPRAMYLYSIKFVKIRLPGIEIMLSPGILLK